ncbi:hypothetical protein B0T11DRAFT_123587 [Plectosphaerella cucumerina]|uniref:C2H2-type domain-containing protein n=1 Tax=Plectosphaerella cucumerina TaxID=40658 RepID=A0A8K0TEW1_9PEZI|nr:hypothetical protein B0T11DRAFT_123587 [Plectosphaerella cucumerina]
MTTSAARPPHQAPPDECYGYDPESSPSRGSPRMESIKPDLGPGRSPQFATPRHVEFGRGEAVLIKHLSDGCKEHGAFMDDAPPTFVVDVGSQFRPVSPVQSSPATNPPKLDLVHATTEQRRQASEGPDQPCRLPIREDRDSSGGSVGGISGPDHYSSRPSMTAPRHGLEVATSASPPQSGSGGLPPLQIDSPRSDHSGHGRALPSIRQHFSDLQLSPDKDVPGRRHASSFSRSPPSGLPGISSMPNFTGPHPTSPTSPGSNFRRDLPSPQAVSASSYGFLPYMHSRPLGGEHTTAPPDSPTSDQPASLAIGQAVDRLVVEHGNGSNQHGTYVCTFSGCTAAPFQTQYLLNSHANVHSSARPHYCPVPGCSRSEGGKGFKRKNEMIRHGLVHESPGYVCPFCPDREHKYPRPDNLQRHVRVHHVDKDKDDPLLRDVLSQRPDGPNRGRRRRGLAL